MENNKRCCRLLHNYFIYQIKHISVNITVSIKLNFNLLARVFCPGEEFIVIPGVFFS